MDVRVACLAACLSLALLLCCLPGCPAQAYHYSNGWMPGRKRASALYSTREAAEQPICSVRPHVARLIAKLLETEASRMSRDCPQAALRLPAMLAAEYEAGLFRDPALAAWIQDAQDDGERVMKQK